MSLPEDARAARAEINTLIARMLELAPVAGLYIGIKIEAARTQEPAP